MALGRAIISNPSVFLMDEPLCNLDAKLRVQMRRRSSASSAVGTTTIYVTHDQVEAMTMGDRIMVLRFGRIQQVGPPEELYNSPANMFVAGFIGSPAMTLPGRLEGNAAGLALVTRSGRLPLPPQIAARLRIDNSAAAGPREVMWASAPRTSGWARRPRRAGMASTCGHGRPGRRPGIGRVRQPRGQQRNIVARTPADARPAENETVGVRINPNKLHLFDAKTEETLLG